MKTFVIALTLAITTSSGITQAATPEHDMSQHQMAMQTATQPTGAGVLKAVNAKDGKVQIAHEAISALGWPPMTMWFAIRDSVPQNIKVGDTIRFEMIENEKKQWVIIKMEPK